MLNALSPKRLPDTLARATAVGLSQPARMQVEFACKFI